MDHREIEERDVARLYCLGKLSEEERLRFEAHFVACEQCLERLELLRSFRSGLKQATAEDVALAQPVAGWIGWLAASQAWKRAAVLGAAALVLVIVPVSVSLWNIVLLRRQLAATRSASSGWENRYQQLRTSNALQQNLQEPKLSASAAVFTLSISRSAPRSLEDSASSQPVNRIVISRAAQWVAFSLEGAYGPKPKEYRATLNDAGGRLIWQGNRLVSATPDSVGLVLPTEVFESGDYLLILETKAGDGSYVNAARYRFRVHIRD